MYLPLMNTTAIKSERGAKITMGKLERAYKAAQKKTGLAIQTHREELTEAAWEAIQAARAEETAVYVQMTALSDAAKIQGLYVSCDTIRWNESPTRALILANID